MDIDILELGLYTLVGILGITTGGSFILPPKLAKFLGLGFKVAKTIGDFGDNLIESPAGLELKPEAKEEAKKKVYESIGKVLASKTEKFDEEDIVTILHKVGSSKGTQRFTSEIVKFTDKIKDRL